MSDLGDYWRDVKSYFREKKAKREEKLEEFGFDLIKKGIEDYKLTIHEFADIPPKWRVSNAEGKWVDYWPTTGTIYSGKYNIRDCELNWAKVGKTIASLLN